uniref:aminopeptidase N n=1 Tax=Amycolatopsis kentuckyensis TaxID=218823 RepID=UPI000A3C4AA6
MPAPNLTRDQAKLRADLLDVTGYDIELDLTDGHGGPGEKTFASTTTVRFSSARAGESTWVDLVADRVHSATLNGADVDVSAYVEDKGIALAGLAESNELTVTADCRYMNTGEGLHRFVDPVDDGVYLYTQFETADAKRMFACFDQPDLKSVYRLTVIAPKDWKVVSNAIVESTEETPEGAVRTVFKESERISTYLVALVAGPYAEWRDEYTDEHKTIPLGIYCRASLAEHMDADRLFTETKQGFGFYHEKFGTPYPFSKYDQLFVPEFNAGAMENAGAVTFLEDYVFRSRVTRYAYERRAETLLHEMAHMWFGDLVTMRWWDDLWLNESFATFASVLAQAEATEYKNAWTSFANIEKSWAYRQDQLPSTHPIAADIVDLHAVEVNFDGITYAKGASVLKQLVAYVGLDHFLDGLKVYFGKHAWGNATLADLLGALEEASGRDLSWWSAQWLETTGLNSLSPRYEIGADGTFTSFAVVQSGAKPGAGELRTHRVAVGVYDEDGSGKIVRTQRVELDVDGERTEVPDLVGRPAGKLVLVNDDDLTYCTMRLDPASLTTLIDRIADITEPLPRTLCWSAAWEMTREAELKARDFVTLVQRGIHTETEVGVVQRLLLQAQTALNSYAEQEWAASTGWPA